MLSYRIVIGQLFARRSIVFQKRTISSILVPNLAHSHHFNHKFPKKLPQIVRRLSEMKEGMSLRVYDCVVNDTLEDLADHFDRLADEGMFDEQFDCTLADGVLTVYLGVHGTYVINKQTPNRQLWLSSPISGPKRYDYKGDTWFYSHEPDRSLHELLTEELSLQLKSTVDFTQLSHGKLDP